MLSIRLLKFPKIYTRTGSAESFVTFSKGARKRSVIATRFKCNLVALAAERVFRRTYLEFICASHSTRNFIFGFEKLRNSSHERINILGKVHANLRKFLAKKFRSIFVLSQNFRNFWLNAFRKPFKQVSPQLGLEISRLFGFMENAWFLFDGLW